MLKRASNSFASKSEGIADKRFELMFPCITLPVCALRAALAVMGPLSRVSRTEQLVFRSSSRH